MQVERGGPQILMEVGVLAQRWKLNEVDFPPSGARVSNTWESTLETGITVGNDC